MTTPLLSISSGARDRLHLLSLRWLSNGEFTSIRIAIFLLMKWVSRSRGMVVPRPPARYAETNPRKMK